MTGWSIYGLFRTPRIRSPSRGVTEPGKAASGPVAYPGCARTMATSYDSSTRCAATSVNPSTWACATRTRSNGGTQGRIRTLTSAPPRRNGQEGRGSLSSWPPVNAHRRSRRPSEDPGSGDGACGQYGSRCCCSGSRRCSCCGWRTEGSSACCSRNRSATREIRGAARPP